MPVICTAATLDLVPYGDSMLIQKQQHSFYTLPTLILTLQPPHSLLILSGSIGDNSHERLAIRT